MEENLKYLMNKKKLQKISLVLIVKKWNMVKIQIYLKKKGIVFGKADPIRGYTRKEKELSSKIKEETVLTNLLLEESEVAIDEEEAKKFGIDSKNLEYGNNIASEIYLEKEKDKNTK